MTLSNLERVLDVPVNLAGDRQLFRRSLWVRWPWRLAIVACALGAALFGLAAPFFQKFFVDRLAGYPDSNYASWIAGWPTWTLMAGAFGCLLVNQALVIAAGLLGFRESSILQRALAKKVFDKTLSLRAENLGGRSTGEIVALYATDVQGATAFFELSLPVGAGIVFPLILGPWLIHTLFGVPLGGMLIVLGVVTATCALLAWRQARMFLRFKQLASERTGLVNEWVQNIRTLRILSWITAFEQKIFAKREEETVNRVRMVTNGQVMSSVGSSASFVLNIVAVSGLVAARDASVTPGEILALLWILGIFLSRPFRQIPWVFTFTMDGITSLKRVESFLQIPTPEEPIAPPAALTETYDTPPALEIRNLSLTLGGKPILHRVSFDLRPGELVAVVGEVGSGKTMLALSLLGETSARFDSYRLGSRDALRMSAAERRSYFGFVPQDGFVASSSLRDNVVFDYGASSAHDDEVKRSLRLSQFDIESERLLEGLETELGERGVNLSGGQRQRVALARAHYYDRPILVLDDSLSAVDVDTERKLLSELIKGEWLDRTRLLITHRLSVLPDVHRVIFLENGRISAEGRYEDLLRSSVSFRAFVEVLSRQTTTSKVLS